jgi:hypothetical protein
VHEIEPPRSESGTLPAAATEPAPAAHRPRLRHERRGSTWLLQVGLEVVLVSAGVFLALMGEQWRERARERELAHASLGRFRAEIHANRKAVQAVREYHVTVYKALETYFATEPDKRKGVPVRITGVQPVFFEKTAWDLALHTEALAHVDSDVAFALSRIYGLQETYGDMTGRLMQALYLQSMSDSFLAFRHYYADIVLWEPALIRMYDEILPAIDRALGDGPTRP